MGSLIGFLDEYITSQWNGIVVHTDLGVGFDVAGVGLFGNSCTVLHLADWGVFA